jgi:hypothetical protein
MYIHNDITIDVEYLWKMIRYYTPNSTDTKITTYTKSDYTHINEWSIYTVHFGYAIPSKEAIQKIKQFVNNDELLEIGAGLGLWSYLLLCNNVKVHVTDSYVDDWNCCRGYKFTPVEHIEGIDALEKYKTKCLMLIWPDLSRMAYEMLQIFKGNKFIYIGEERDDLSAEDKFFDLLEKKWKLIDKIYIPRFHKDYVHLYEQTITNNI